MTKKISIKKLAEELNLAPSTVHRALSGHPNVSVDTRREVLRVSQMKGYTLPAHEKGSIAVIVPYLSFNGYLGCLLPCLETEFHRQGFRLMIVSEEDIAILGDHMFDGIISLVWNDSFGKLRRFCIFHGSSSWRYSSLCGYHNLRTPRCLIFFEVCDTINVLPIKERRHAENAKSKA